jgi:hypothetical protein
MRFNSCRAGLAACLLALAPAGLPGQEQTGGGITI